MVKTWFLFTQNGFWHQKSPMNFSKNSIQIYDISSGHCVIWSLLRGSGKWQRTFCCKGSSLFLHSALTSVRLKVLRNIFPSYNHSIIGHQTVCPHVVQRIFQPTSQRECYEMLGVSVELWNINTSKVIHIH